MVIGGDEKEPSNLGLCEMVSVWEFLEKNCEGRKIYAEATKVDLENANETLKFTAIRSLIQERLRSPASFQQV